MIDQIITIFLAVFLCSLCVFGIFFVFWIALKMIEDR